MLFNPSDPWSIASKARSYLLLTDFSDGPRRSRAVGSHGAAAAWRAEDAKVTPEHHNTVQFALIYYAISGGCSSVHGL